MAQADLTREEMSGLPLTPREIEVLKIAAMGGTANAIGLALDCSPETAKNHLNHIHMKLGVKTTIEALVVMLKRGIIHLEEL